MKRSFLAACVAGLVSFSAFACGGDYQSHKRFVAHEWGTFTSVQGQDGVQVEWNPFVAPELPTFVYDRNRPNREANRMAFGTYASKTSFMARQRMETPVIYFYSPEQKSADVRVDFPTGLMTEWYPKATDCDAQRRGPEREGMKKTSFLEWKGVEILASQGGAETLPTEKGKSHYYAARETDASMLRVKGEAEKFLFYRGVGHFEAPLNTSLALDGKMLMLQNKGKEELHNLLVIQVGNGKYKVSQFDALSADLFLRVPLDGLEEISRDDLKAAIEKGIVAENLYATEAKAMVKTWEDSWLDESGLRVLYVLGKRWTDETLPLNITPKPDETVRVMIGRAEVITPAMELALQEAIVEYQKGGAAAQIGAIAKARAIGLGRFVDAAARRLCKKNPGAEFSKAAFEVASKSFQPAPAARVASNIE